MRGLQPSDYDIAQDSRKKYEKYSKETKGKYLKSVEECGNMYIRDIL